MAAAALASLCASCGGGNSSAPGQPLPKPSIREFTATPATVAPGATSTLTWAVTGATILQIDHGVGSVTGVSVVVRPLATTTYTLTGTNASGSATATVIVSIGSAPLVASFAARPSWVTTGHSSTLTWSVTGATSLNIDPIGPVSSTSTPVTPAADATYVLTASNQFGTSQAQVTVEVFPPPTGWFAPFPPNLFPNYGSADYTDLFSATAPWSEAARHIQVFEMYPYTLSLPDADLRNLFADLKRRHIAVALSQGGLTQVGSSSCSGDFDGVSGLSYAQRIRDMGGSLQYIALDEPFAQAVLADGPASCRWTLEQTVSNVAATVAKIQTVFPDALVGDVEILPSNDSAISTYVADYERWADAWKSTTGRPFAFFQADVQWANNWKPAVIALSRALQKRQIQFGQIYIGDQYATSDGDWIAAAEQRMTDFETHSKPMLDQVIFESWLPYPRHVLPETDPTAFTYLIDRYFRDRTTVTLSAADGVAQGVLMGKSAPLGGANVLLTSVPLLGNGQTTAYTYSGVAPAGAQYVVFGARVGWETCSAMALPAELYLTDFTLDGGAAAILHADFSNGLNGWQIWGAWSIAQIEQGTLHTQVLPAQWLGLNSTSLPFPAAGSAYTLTVHATIPPGSHGNGCAIAVFQDGNFQELARATLQIVPLPVNLGTAQTDANGGYTFNLAPQSEPIELWADYTGSATAWPAAASAPIRQGPRLAIATNSLADGAVTTVYAQALSATGGRPRYLWVGAGLPPGLELGQDGRLAGTPTAAGTYTVSVSVVDDSAPTQVVDASYPLVIH